MKAVMHLIVVNVDTLDIEAARSLFFKTRADCEAAVPAVENMADHALGPHYAAKGTCATVERVSDPGVGT